MSKSQNTVIWIGLILVALNLVVHIGDLKSLIFGAPSSAGNPVNTPAGNAVAPSQPSAQPNPTPTAVQAI